MTQNWGSEEVIEQSSDNVPRKRLVGTDHNLLLRPFQRLGIVQGWLYETPYFEYLEEGELPEFLFASSSPIIERTSGQDHRLSPGRGYSSLIGLTDRRVLVVVGQRPENDTRAMEYNDIDAFSIAPKRELSVRTKRDGEPEIPSTPLRITLETASRDLEIQPKGSYEVSGVLDDLAPFLSGQIGIEDWEHNEQWLDARRQYQRTKDRYEDWVETVSERARRARDDSVTVRRLKRIWDDLKWGEQPHFDVRGNEHHQRITQSVEKGPSETNGMRFTLFTDQRILIKDERDETSISYDSLVDSWVDEEEVSTESGEDETQVYLHLPTVTVTHIIHIANLSTSQISDLLSFINDKSGK